jgi:hypothetical protein
MIDKQSLSYTVWDCKYHAVQYHAVKDTEMQEEEDRKEDQLY